MDQELLATGLNVRDISPDGRWLLCSQNRADTGNDVLVRPLPDSPPSARTAAALGEPQPIAASPANEMGPQFSPDGRWVVYQSNATGRFEVYVKAFPGGGQEHRLSTDGGFSPKWHPSGREVFYRSPANAMVAVPLTAAASGLTAGPPRRLFDATPAGRQLPGRTARPREVRKAARRCHGFFTRGPAPPQFLHWTGCWSAGTLLRCSSTPRAPARRSPTHATP